MRATISFEADVSKVNTIMRALVLEESNTLQDAWNALERATPERLANGITEALDHIHAAVAQLEQYRDMVVSFERAKFETVQPQPVDQPAFSIDPNPPGTSVESVRKLQEMLGSLSAFDNFVEKMEPTEDEEGEPNVEPEEG